MNFLTEVYWDTGKCPVNQDSISLQEVFLKGERIVFTLICDGIGGLWKGELASGFVAEQMTEWFYKEAIPMMEKRKSKNKIRKSGIRSLYACNQKMKDFSEENKEQMGTTVTMLLFHRKNYFLWHSGDTRAYRIAGRGRKGRMKQLTRDHAAQQQVLTKCIGSFVWKEPDSHYGRFTRKNTFLLCSDGFRHIVSDEKMMETLLPEYLTSKEQIERRLREIAEYSKREGEMDNISAVVIRTG